MDKKIFWVWTADHAHDSLVVETMGKQAEKEIQRRGGYEDGDCYSREVASVPSQHQHTACGVVGALTDGALLHACGGQAQIHCGQTGWRFGADLYIQGRAVMRAPAAA